ncbi:MAG: hypothetical protein SCARUB_01999 [Candidatus Scalindua rubra]|uniref:Restriction endonuclease n=1 Tax=Candidatus Scalindua rubra TaxID=1872076 RepID=A0A1E3XBB8_9BACT|nr:MAG: hypothetical protein SCARUB_01999 [Candidatus Scalindua rubra]
MTETIDLLHIGGPEQNAWENFESLCANLIECRYVDKPVSRVRPDPGDEGVDILVGPIEKPSQVFQCKYFTRRIGSSQRQQIQSSYRRVYYKFFPRSWTLITPIDPSTNELRWFEENLAAVNSGEARRWWGKTHLINLLSQYEHIADTYFDLATRRRIREIHDSMVNAPETLDDQAALGTVYLFFDRPAFRLAFENEASIPDFDRAMKDTILALNTGVLRTRDGFVVARGKPRSAFSDLFTRKQLEAATSIIEQITVILASAVDGGVFKRYRGSDRVWVFDHPDAHRVAEELNNSRNDVIRAANEAFTRMGLPVLPLITDKLDGHGYIGRSNHHFLADADHLE